MSEKDEIIKKFKSKIKNLKLYNKLYHGDDNPKISDADYDKLKEEIFTIEKKYSFIKDLNLTKNLVGFSASNKFKKIRHLKPMLSLANAFDENDIKVFIKKILNFLNSKEEKIDLHVEPKIDGISATLIYEKGILIKGLSRGDGIIGEDILNNLRTINTIPKKIVEKKFLI